MIEGALIPNRGGIVPEKIRRQYRERLAIVYISQSTPQQVERHQESTRLQYALFDRAIAFGWAGETVDQARLSKDALAFSDWSWRSVSATSDWLLA
jgi:hypothetical protein